MKLINSPKTPSLEQRLTTADMSPMQVKDLIRRTLRKRDEIEKQIEACFDEIEALHEDSEAVAEFVDALLDVLSEKRSGRA